jgi:PAS domain S-box-containing protein
MITRVDSHLLNGVKYVPMAASIIVSVIGCLVLAGWMFDLSTLKSVLPRLAPMKANTALSFILCGAALFLLRNEDLSAKLWKKRLAQLCALTVASIGILTFGEYAFGWNIGIDQLLSRGDQDAGGEYWPGRMALATAINFLLVGCALLFMEAGWAQAQRLSQWLALIAGLISLLAVIGYAYGAESFYKFSSHSSVAIYTAIAFIVLALGILFARGKDGPMSVILRDSSGGALARRVLPAAFVLPVILGWLRLKGQQAGFYGTEFGLSVFAATNIMTFAWLIWRAARSLDRTDAERRLAEGRFGQLIEHAPNGIVMVDQRGVIVLVNTHIEESFGYGRDELLGQPIEILVPRRFHAHHSGYRNLFIAAPSARPMGAGRELFGLRRDGTEFPVEIGLNPIETEHGVMVLGTIVDITERKHAQETLQRNQAQLAGIIGSAMDAIVSVDGDQRIVVFNASAERMFKCSADEAVGQSLDRFIPERLRATHRTHIEGFGQTNVTRRKMGSLGAIFGLRSDGEEFPIEASISQLESDGQKFYTVILRDITERKRTEDALYASEARFSTAFNSSPISSVLATLDEGRYVAVNDTFLKLTGYSRGEVIGRTSTDLGVWTTAAARAEVIEQLKKEGRIRNRETIYRMKNDEERIFLTSAEVIELDGQAHMITASVDITETKHFQRALELSEETLRVAIAGANLGTWHWDIKTDELIWSDKCRALFDIPPDEQITSKRFLEALHPDDRERTIHSIEKALKNHSEYDNEYRAVWHDRSIHWISAKGLGYYDGDGKAFRMSGVVLDITERKRAEEEIRKLNAELEHRVIERTEQLQAANKELEAFSYSVSHDLRAPLRHINGFSQALLEDYADKLDEEGKGYLKQVRGASQEMGQLIDDLLQLARVTRSEMRREVVNLSQIATAVLANLKEMDSERSVDVKIEKNLLANCDKRLLRVVLSNLLGNAWKFTGKREHAQISFGREKKNGQTVYFVRDNGAGFDMAYAGKLFGAFQRLHSSSEFEGTGIGLATVQRVVNRHGGRVWAEGKVDELAVFYFTLPEFKDKTWTAK